MAVVISSEERSHFPSSLRRSHSAPKFNTKTSGFRTSSSGSRINELEYQPIQVFSDSAPTSPPPSPSTITTNSTQLSPAPKPAPDLALGSSFGHLELDSAQAEEQFSLPQYGDGSFFNRLGDFDTPSSHGGLDSSYRMSPGDNTISTGTSRPETPDLCFEHAEDDTAVRAQPSRHVDYLSHDWKEEDIWESWKFIISRRGDYSNSARLENASWRTWMKSKNRLKTVSPETLNWLKDCDVTWLYGPLQTGNNSLLPPHPTDSSELTKSNSFLHKKPILKKRSMSELMLQRSLSASSLVKQAAAAVQAQQKDGEGRAARPRLERAISDYVTLPFSSRRISPGISSNVTSSTSSGIASPGVERKHIHFNEQVEQCIAVDAKGEDDEEEVEPPRYPYDSDSDDGAIMMKTTVSKKKRRPTLRRKISANSTADSKTIAMLPSTTLKSREDSPEPAESGTAMKHSYRSPVLSPSSSQETLRPAKPSGKLFIVDDDDDDDDDDEEDDEDEDEEEEEEDDDEEDDDSSDPDKRSSLSKIANSVGSLSAERPSGLKRTTSSNSLTGETGGMRRTESGMLMPYEEGEPTAANGGIVGRVIDTVNTARDIAHVIWNVGWRK